MCCPEGHIKNVSIRNDKKRFAPGEDRTRDLQIALSYCDYETDALPTALPRHLFCTSTLFNSVLNYV